MDAWNVSSLSSHMGDDDRARLELKKSDVIDGLDRNERFWSIMVLSLIMMFCS